MVPIRDPIIHRTVFLVRNPSKPVTQAAREIERVIVDIVAELVRKKLWRGELAESLKTQPIARISINYFRNECGLP